MVECFEAIKKINALNRANSRDLLYAPLDSNQVLTVLQTGNTICWQPGKHLLPDAVHIYLPLSFTTAEIDSYLEPFK